MQRGIIGAPGVIVRRGNGLFCERGLSDEEIRYYIMYWDKVVIPSNNFVNVKLPGEKELLSLGALSRPKIKFPFDGSYSGKGFANAVLSCQSIMAQRLISEINTDWVVHQIGNKLEILPNFSAKNKILQMFLIGALPVPTSEIPIEDILNFKEKRHNELNELHNAIDDLYCDILKNPDQAFATKKAMARLKESILNLESTTKERFNNFKQYNLEIQFNLSGKDLMQSASYGALIDFLCNPLSAPIATIAGAIVSMIKISVKTNYTFNPAANKDKLGYLSHAKKKNIINRL